MFFFVFVCFLLTFSFGILHISNIPLTYRVVSDFFWLSLITQDSFSPDPYNTSSQIDLWSFSGCITCYPLASLWKLVGVLGYVYKCCSDLVMQIRATSVKHLLGRSFKTIFNFQCCSKMQKQCLHRASDKDSTVREA